MYEQFYRLREKPFTTLPDPDFLYMSKSHETALSYLEYGFSSQAGFMVLTGEIGSGKTTLINYLLGTKEVSANKTALIINTNITPRELLETLLREWKVDCKAKTKAALRERLTVFLLEEYRKQTNLLVIIDEAHNLPFGTMEEVRMLSNLNDEKTPLLHIIFSGQPGLITRLNQPRLEQLRQRVTVHYHLGPLDRDETARYIVHRLQKAGAATADIFLPEAFDSIYEHSRGIPRIINLICDLSLVYGYAEQANPVDKTIVELVVTDRLKMGLGFGGGDQISDDSDRAKGKNALYGRAGGRPAKGGDPRLRELHDDILKLTQMVRESLGVRESVAMLDRKYGREIVAVKQEIRDLQHKVSCYCAGSEQTEDKPR